MFSKVGIVSCGTLSLEIKHLMEGGFLNPSCVYFTTPGLHERPLELERQFVLRVKKAKEKVSGVIVLWW